MDKPPYFATTSITPQAKEMNIWWIYISQGNYSTILNQCWRKSYLLYYSLLCSRHNQEPEADDETENKLFIRLWIYGDNFMNWEGCFLAFYLYRKIIKNKLNKYTYYWYPIFSYKNSLSFIFVKLMVLMLHWT